MTQTPDPGRLYGAIELGGTKVCVGIGTGDGALRATGRIETRDPAATIGGIADFFRDRAAEGQRIAAAGVGAFGPILLDPRRADFGTIASTPKPGWSGFRLHAALRDALGVPIALDTDVAAAAIGEHRSGALRGVGCGVYVTVGTGIGGAVLLDGRPLTGRLHPEIGHLPLARLLGDALRSACPFHSDCAEGLASGPAIQARFGKPLDAFAPGGEEHRLVAAYLGRLCSSIVLAVSPERIVLGGGVAKTPGLHAPALSAMIEALGGYAADPPFAEDFIVPPALGDDAALTGCLIRARECEGLS